ncbi:fimbrial protein [Erwinia sp. AnSW2-5]|uniref:fimbrial protein n=1 Tax=Erwinia sp. AnSW2-5 TaxID=3367692 RepID=UPI0038585789
MHNVKNIFPCVRKKLHSGIVLLTIAVLMVSQSNISAEECKYCSIDVSFTGTYNDETCEVIINGKGNTETIELPEISTQSLKEAGSEAGSTTFVIGLKNCPTDRNIKLKFVSNVEKSDTSTGNLLNTSGDGYSKNTQIRLRKDDGTQIGIDDLTSAQNYYIPESGNIVTHDYTASYYSSGISGATSGLVKTTAGIEINYK